MAPRSWEVVVMGRPGILLDLSGSGRVGLSSGICKCSAIGPEDAEAVVAEMDGYWMLGTGAENDAETGTAGAVTFGF